MLLYIHVPFCATKCPYCSFVSYDDKKNLITSYFDALLVDLEYQIKKYKISKRAIDSVFVGGGTPSVVDFELYEAIFGVLQPYLHVSAEISSEANPNSASEVWLEGMKNIGVNRISFGVQSFDEQKLRFLGRKHSANEALQAVQNAHKLGFVNISVDLIYGTAMDTKELLGQELHVIDSLPLSHISAYSLMIEKNTPFAKKPQNAKNNNRLDRWFVKELNSRFAQYEISNFGATCRHNMGYWQGCHYLGVGCSAVGFVDGVRYYGTNSLENYIKNPHQKTQERLDVDELKMERVFLGLRSNVGVDLLTFNKEELKKIKILEDEKKITIEKNRVKNKDFLLSDEIALFILS